LSEIPRSSRDLNELKILRKKIREVTEKIIALSGERVELARRVGVIKRRLGMSIEDQKVESQLKRDMIRLCEERGLNVEFGLNLLHLLFEESKRVQKEEPQL